jgi:eukaryotic-like serine/threonine-protein kinase
MVHFSLPVEPGDLVADKYRIELVLGRGGMGVVFAATHIQLEQRVAIKFLVEGASLPEMRERFAREARAASKIRSEHVARVLDVGALEGGTPYTVMEYLAGEDLSKALRSRGALPVAEAVGYVLQACEALAEAHVAGIVHRDIKPANMFLAQRADGSIALKLLDFGISKVTTPGAHGVVTQGTAVMGSPTYMPPEQLRSARDVDARGDLWSLGATLFELVAGRPPFRGETLTELCARIIESPAPDLESFLPDAPPGLTAVLHRCLAKDPANRFANVAEVAAALEPFGPIDARVSVERAARVLGAAAAKRPSAPIDSGTHRLQDAETMRRGAAGDVEQPAVVETRAVHEETAPPSILSPASSTRRSTRTIVAAGVGAAIAIAAALAGLRANERGLTAPTAASTTQLVPSSDERPLITDSTRDPLMANAPPAVGSTTASATPAAPPSAATTSPSTLRPTIARPQRAVPGSATPATSATATAAPPPRSSTDGFGDRK